MAYQQCFTNERRCVWVVSWWRPPSPNGVVFMNSGTEAERNGVQAGAPLAPLPVTARYKTKIIAFHNAFPAVRCSRYRWAGSKIF